MQSNRSQHGEPGNCVKTTGHSLRWNEGQNMSTCSDTSGARHLPSLPVHSYIPGENRTGLIMRISFVSRISCSLKSYLLSSQMILSCSPFLGKTNKGRKLKCCHGGVWKHRFLDEINRAEKNPLQKSSLMSFVL